MDLFVLSSVDYAGLNRHRGRHRQLVRPSVPLTHPSFLESCQQWGASDQLVECCGRLVHPVIHQAAGAKCNRQFRRFADIRTVEFW